MPCCCFTASSLRIHSNMNVTYPAFIHSWGCRSRVLFASVDQPSRLNEKAFVPSPRHRTQSQQLHYDVSLLLDRSPDSSHCTCMPRLYAPHVIREHKSSFPHRRFSDCYKPRFSQRVSKYQNVLSAVSIFCHPIQQDNHFWALACISVSPDASGVCKSYNVLLGALQKNR